MCCSNRLVNLDTSYPVILDVLHNTFRLFSLHRAPFVFGEHYPFKELLERELITPKQSKSLFKCCHITLIFSLITNLNV